MQTEHSDVFGILNGMLRLAQAEFSEHHEAEVGNEAIVKGLIELRKYWDALEGDFRVEATSAEDTEEDKKGRTRSVNHGVQLTLDPVCCYPW